jgi:rhamnosyltransferase
MDAALPTTVLILCRDAGPRLRLTLEAIAAQQPAPAEVLVIDSGSRDGSLELARRSGARVQAIAPEAFDFGLTRDLGCELARGELVASLSQDVVPRPGWLGRITAPFADPAVAYVSARAEAWDPERMFLWQRLGRFYFTREMTRFRARWGVPCSNACSALRRSVWQLLRHGPMPIAEDLLFQQRVLAAGHRTVVIDEPLAWHQHDYDLGQAFRRAWNEGLGARHLGIAYGPLDAVADGLRPDNWLALARQLRYRRVRRASELLYPLLRPLALYGGHRLGRRYWR